MVIVTGQPRSGTSLMMRILSSSMNVICDETLSYECSRTIDLPKNNDWISDLPQDSAIKVLWPLVTFLPVGVDYKVIWMHRDPKEQSKSQQKFLGNSEEWRAEREILINKTEKSAPQIVQLGKGVKLIIVSFEMLLKRVGLKRIEDFLGINMDSTPIFTRNPEGGLYSVGHFENMEPQQWK